MAVDRDNSLRDEGYGAVNMHRVKLVVLHVETLKGGGHTAANMVFYFGVLLMAALLFTALDQKIAVMLFTPPVISMAVFASLLFSLHMMIYTYMKKAGEAEKSMMGYLFQLYINVTFCILAAVTAIAALFTYGLKTQIGGGEALPWLRGPMDRIASFYLISAASSSIDLLLVFLIYLLLFVFLGTLFLILGRVHLIIAKDPHIKQL